MMNRQVLTTVLAAAGLAWGCVMAQGDQLARWNSEGADPQAGSYAPTNLAAGLSVSNLVRGSGLKAGSAGGTFAANGYSTTAKTYEAAVAAGDYWEMSLTPQNGLVVFETLSYSFGGSKTGPTNWQWAVKVGTGDWTKLGTLESFVRSDTKYKLCEVDLQGIVPTDQQVGFRLVGWGASNDSGTGSFGQKTNVLAISGTVQSFDGPPVVSFVPAAGAVDLGKTLEMAVSVQPGGSGVKTWSFTPEPAGTASLSGGTFTFTPAEADVLQQFTLSVTATNAQGTTTAETSVMVNEEAAEGTLTLTFDNEQQDSWNGAKNVPIPAGSAYAWSMEKCIIGKNDENDKLYGGAGRALRFSYDEPGVFQSLANNVVTVSGVTTNDVQINGVDKISFWYGIYGGDVGEESEHSVRPPIVTELSDDGKLWVEVDRVSTEGSEEQLQKREITVGVETPVYFRIRIEGVSGSSRVNVDQMRIVPKVTEKSAYVKGLLQYNVTPGDDLTGKNDDWDGDGVKNQTEVSLRHTDPYYDPDRDPNNQ